MLNGLDSDQERHFVSPDLGPNWLQLISTYQQTTKVRPNKKISVFRVTGLKILGRVGTHIFFIIFFLEIKIILCIWKGISSFKMHQIIFFPEKPEKNRGFTSKFR